MSDLIERLIERLTAKSNSVRELLAMSVASDPDDWLAAMPADTAREMEDEAELFEAAAEALRLSCKGVEGWRMAPVEPDDRQIKAGVAAIEEAERLTDRQWATDLYAKAAYKAMVDGYYCSYCDDDADGPRCSRCGHRTNPMLAAAPVSPSPLMDFGAFQVLHQPSAATSPEGSDPTQVKLG